MSTEKEKSVMMGVLRNGYQSIFYENWPIWFGGVLIGIVSILTIAWARPWGVAGGLRNWGDWILYLSGAYKDMPVSPLTSTNSILTLGLLWGAFSAALLSKQFALRMAPPLELVKGCIGGALMGIGAAMAGGCNVGGFYSAISALSLSGFMMMIGLLIGAYVGLKYLYWEMEHLPSSGGGSFSTQKKDGLNLRSISPYIGALVMLAAFAFAWVSSERALTKIGVLLLCGFAFGMIIQRTRLCFVRGFRDPFMTGEADVSKALAVSIIISMLGYAVLKWNGIRPEQLYVNEAFWIGGLVGGIIFGVGMVVAGGCGSGSVWRAGEGHIKLMLAVLCFSLSTSLFKAWIKSSQTIKELMGSRVYLPDLLTYKGAIIFVIVIMGLFYLIAAWNDKTGKLIVEP